MTHETLRKVCGCLKVSSPNRAFFFWFVMGKECVGEKQGSLIESYRVSEQLRQGNLHCTRNIYSYSQVDHEIRKPKVEPIFQEFSESVNESSKTS